MDYIAWDIKLAEFVSYLNTDSELLDSLRANIKECALLLLEDYVKDISKVSISIEVPFLVNKNNFA